MQDKGIFLVSSTGRSKALPLPRVTLKELSGEPVALTCTNAGLLSLLIKISIPERVCQNEGSASAFGMLMQAKSWKIIKNYSLKEMNDVKKNSSESVALF